MFFSVHSDSSTNLCQCMLALQTIHIYLFVLCDWSFSVFVNCHKFGDLCEVKENDVNNLLFVIVGVVATLFGSLLLY